MASSVFLHWATTSSATLEVAFGSSKNLMTKITTSSPSPLQSDSRNTTEITQLSINNLNLNREVANLKPKTEIKSRSLRVKALKVMALTLITLFYILVTNRWKNREGKRTHRYGGHRIFQVRSSDSVESFPPSSRFCLLLLLLMDPPVLLFFKLLLPILFWMH